MRDQRVKRKRWLDLAILLVYFAVAVGMTWPLVEEIDERLAGATDDTLVHYWNGWWAKQALTTGKSPFYTPYLYYPTGISLVTHNFAWNSIVIWLILEPLVGGLVAYNLSILINLVLCGFAAFLLAYELTGDSRAAFIAGLIYQCWPFRLSQLDHPNLISTQWIPLFLLFLIRAVRQSKWQDGVLAGVFLVLTGYTRWQQLVPAAILGTIALVCTLPGRRASWRQWGPALLLAGAITALALAPPFLMLMRQQHTEPASLLKKDEEESMQTDLLAYVTPSQYHPVLNSITDPAYAHYYADRSEPRRSVAYIGLTVLALIALGTWKARKAGLMWAAMASALILLALGPILRLNGQLYPNVPMPYRLAARLYVVRLMRIPARFNMFLALPVSMLSTYGVVHLLALVKRRGKWAAWAILGLLSATILFEYVVVPIPFTRPKASEFDEWLSTEPDDFAVLNLPISAFKSKKYMAAQTVHRHPIVQGKTPRFPKGTLDYLNNQPWIKALLEIQALPESGSMPPQPTDISRQLETLAQDNIQYIILYKKWLHLAHWRRYFSIDPTFEDERIAVYPTSPRAGSDFILTEELAPGIGLITATVSSDCLPPGQPLSVDVGWGTTAPPGQNLDVRLALVTREGTMETEKTFPLYEGWPTGEWPANTVARGNYRLDTSALPEDDYDILLALAEETGAVCKPPTTMGQVTIRKKGCDLHLPPEAAPVNALFGGELRLLGYQISRDDDQLTLTLHWRAEQFMRRDYKIFVHVVDPTNDLRVAQDDSKPLRWTYPTPYWTAGEVVVDAIPLSLEEAPPGTYQLIVGIYDTDTKDRAPVIDGSGQLAPDDQMILPEEIEVESLDS
jgi:hypothetical protein